MYKLTRNLIDNSPQYITFDGQIVMNLSDNSFINNMFAQDMVNCLNRTVLCTDQLKQRVEYYQNNQREISRHLSATYEDSFKYGEGC